MKWLAVVIFLSFFLIPAQSQEIVEDLYKLSRKNEYEKVDRTLDSMETRFLIDENWDSLTYIYTIASTIHFKRNQYEKLDSALEKASIICHQYLEQDDPARLFYLGERATIEIEFGEYKMAEMLLDSIALEVGHDSTSIYYARLLLSRSFLMIYQGHYAECKAMVKKAISKLEGNKQNASNLTVAYSLLGYLYSYYGEIDKSLELTNKSFVLFREIYGESHVNVGKLYLDAASAYASLGNSQKSIEFYQKGLDIVYQDYHINNNPRVLVNTLGNMAIHYSSIHENFIAIELAQKALNIQLKNNPRVSEDILWLYNILCDLNLKNGDFEKAQLYNNQSLRLTKDSEISADNKKIYLLNKAEIELYLKNPKTALEIALNLYRDELNQDTQITRIEITSLNFIVQSYIQLKEYDLAKEYIDVWSHKTNQFFGSKTDDAILPVWSLWEIYVKLSEKEKADSIYNYILHKWNNGSDIYTYENMIPSNNVTLYGKDIAKYYSGQFKIGRSLEKYHKFIQSYDKYFQKQLLYFTSDKTINSYYGHLISTYQPLLEEYQKDNPAQGFALIEKLKNFHQRMLLSNKLIRDEKLEKVQKTLNQLVKNSIDSNTNLNYNLITKNLNDFQVYKDSLYKHDRETYLKNYGVSDVNPEIIEQVVKEDEALIEFLKVDTLFYRVTYINEKFYLDTLSYTEIASMIIDLNKMYDIYLAEQLYKKLIPDNISGIDNLLIIPDDILYYLNFELLLNQGQFLIKDYNIRYATSVSINNVQDQLHENIGSDGIVSSFSPGFMPSLKSTINKNYHNVDTSWNYYLKQPFLLNLSQTFKKFNGAQVFEEEMATEYNFKTQAGGHRIIHMGTHGVLKDASPLFSKLVLVMDSIEDGNLHVYELYNQNLNAQLAVLAACSSGDGNLMSGEGVVSIAQAFIKAGVPAVLLSLHDIDEKSTAEILSYFYKNLRTGDKKSVALRKAKLQYLSQVPQELQDPYYWAGLVIIGSDEAIFDVPFYNKLWVRWLVLVAFILILFYLFKRFTRKS